MTAIAPPPNWEQFAFDTVKQLQDALPQATELAVKTAFAMSLADLLIGVIAATLAVIAFFSVRSRRKGVSAEIVEIKARNRYGSEEDAMAWWVFGYFIWYIIPTVLAIIALSGLLDVNNWMGIFAPETLLVIKLFGW